MKRRAVWSDGVKWLRNGALGCGIAFGIFASHGTSSAVFGQTTEQVFGANIHRYYDGQFEELIAEVSKSVNDDLEDPRIYYLRGLAFLKTGDQNSAANDLRKGAELEALQFGSRNYNIARALQRIQGNDRALLESARSEAMKRRSELRSKRAGIPRSQILAEMGRSILDPPPMMTSRPNLPDPSTLSDDTAPFGAGWDTAPSPRPVRPEPKPNASSSDVFSEPTTKPDSDPFGGSESTTPPTGGGGSSNVADPFATPTGQTPPK